MANISGPADPLTPAQRGTPQVSTLLPLPLREALVRASKVDSQVPAGCSIGRSRELDSVISRIRHHNPQHFQQEQ